MLLCVNPLVLCIICLKEGFCEAGNNWREINFVNWCYQTDVCATAWKYSWVQNQNHHHQHTEKPHPKVLVCKQTWKPWVESGIDSQSCCEKREAAQHSLCGLKIKPPSIAVTRVLWHWKNPACVVRAVNSSETFSAMSFSYPSTEMSTRDIIKHWLKQGKAAWKRWFLKWSYSWRGKIIQWLECWSRAMKGTFHLEPGNSHLVQWERPLGCQLDCAAFMR